MARTIDATSAVYARARQIRLGIWIEAFSFAWMIIEASVAISAGVLAASCCGV